MTGGDDRAQPGDHLAVGRARHLHSQAIDPVGVVAVVVREQNRPDAAARLAGGPDRLDVPRVIRARDR